MCYPNMRQICKKMSVLQASITFCKLERISTTDGISQLKGEVGQRNEAQCGAEIISNRVVYDTLNLQSIAQDESMI